MKRWLAILLFVSAIWVGIEVYDEGVDRAFGGLFAGFSSKLDAPADRATQDRAADAFQRAWNKSETRVDAMLREQDAAE